MSISREQLVKRLRQSRFSFKRKSDRVELYRQDGTGVRVNVPLRDLLDEKLVEVVLRQAGLSDREIKEFFAAAVKSPDR